MSNNDWKEDEALRRMNEEPSEYWDIDKYEKDFDDYVDDLIKEEKENREDDSD